MNKKIIHIAIKHHRRDNRVYHKIIHSLLNLYTLSLLVNDGQGDKVEGNLEIIDLNLPNASVIEQQKSFLQGL